MTQPLQIHPGHLAANVVLARRQGGDPKHTSSTPPSDVGSSQWHSTPQLRPPRKTPGAGSPEPGAQAATRCLTRRVQSRTHVHTHLNSGSRPPIGYRDSRRAHLVLAPSCSCLQSSSVLLANIRDSCSDYPRMTVSECSRSLRTCSDYLRRACNHPPVLTFDANDHAGRGP